MNAEQRGQLIRERFKSLGGHSVSLMGSVKKKMATQQVRRNRFCFGPLLIDHPCRWVKTPDPAPAETLRISRVKKDVLTLTKIAAQLPRKLMLAIPRGAGKTQLTDRNTISRVQRVGAQEMQDI